MFFELFAFRDFAYIPFVWNLWQNPNMHVKFVLDQWKTKIQRKPAKKKHYISIHSTGDETQKIINFGAKMSFILSFFLFPERLHCCCYVYFHCS
jgi:hypothetical protein